MVDRQKNNITSLLLIFKSASRWNFQYLYATLTTFLKIKNGEITK